MKYIGILHFLHAPLLCILPFCNAGYLFDYYYTQYSLGIILSYTFTNGECLITLVHKLLMKEYDLIGKITEYSDLIAVVPSRLFIDIYVGTMTALYFASLNWVLWRSGLFWDVFGIFSLLPFFYIYVHKLVKIPQNNTAYICVFFFRLFYKTYIFYVMGRLHNSPK
jgi:hypothetical protein